MLIEKVGIVVMINGDIFVFIFDVDVINGVIYVVNKVIILFDVVGYVVVNSVFFSLVGVLGVVDGDLVNVLKSDGFFIVFVLVDDVFVVI